MAELQIFYRKTDELIPYDKIPRKNDAAVETVAYSIKEIGFKVPIIVDDYDVVIVGDSRPGAAKGLGMEEEPAELIDEQVKELRFADNKVGGS